MVSSRIIPIDGFRCLAVLSVIGYHYLYRFSPPDFFTNYYPYEFGPSILQYGFYGVQLFFVISGFVIAQTLESTTSFYEFMTKRLIRLWPTLVVCSVITFLTIQIFAQEPNSPFFNFSILNFLPSWTFSPPEFWNALLRQDNIVYVDGAYWSLFVEIVFYILSGLIFFWRPGSFLKNWISIVLVLTVIRIITSPRNQFLFPDGLNVVFGVIYTGYLKFYLAHFIYFTIGIFFHSLYCKIRPARVVLGMMSILIALEFYFLASNVLRILFLCVIFLFVILVYKEAWLNFLKFKIIAWIGLVSYPLYLLHENVGVILIKRMGRVVDAPALQFVPLIVAIIMVIISSVIYWYYEKPIISILKIRLKKSINSSVI